MRSGMYPHKSRNGCRGHAVMYGTSANDTPHVSIHCCREGCMVHSMVLSIPQRLHNSGVMCLCVQKSFQDNRRLGYNHPWMAMLWVGVRTIDIYLSIRDTIYLYILYLAENKNQPICSMMFKVHQITSECSMIFKMLNDIPNTQ
jgi:hypothetical protein